MNELLSKLALKVSMCDELSKLQSELPTDIFDWECIFDWINQNKEIGTRDAVTKEVAEIKDMETNEKITDLKTKNILVKDMETAGAIATDLKINNVITREDNYEIIIVLWIENLLKNPFDLASIISLDQIQTLKKFLIFQIKTLQSWKYKKVAIKCLSFLGNQLLKDNALDCFYNGKTGFYLFKESVTEIIFYCFLKNLSKLTKIDRSYTELKDNDSITVKRYKIKIVSYLADRSTVVDNIKQLLQLINTEDSRMGWTISKSIYRMSKLVDKQSLISDLKKLVQNNIFADEQCWINTMCILSFLVLDNENIGDIKFIENVFTYENEFFYKNSLLKETAIFLIWSLIRCSFDISVLINRVVYTSLFDMDFISRRAAACVVQELLGRSKVFEDDLTVYKITPDNIKRRSKCLEIFEDLKNKENYFEFFESSLYSYDQESREIGAVLCAKYINISKMQIRYTSAVEMDGTHLLIKNCLDKDMKCADVFKPVIASFVLTIQNYKIRNMNLACKSYLKIIKYFEELAVIKDNLIFLGTKNFDPIDLYHTSRVFFHDSDFSKKVFDLFAKNRSFVLMNSNNEKFRDNVIEKNVKNIKSNKMVDTCILALKLLKAFNKNVQETVSSYLDDYTISYAGDIGYFNRRAALEYFASIDQKNCSINVENFIIKFMADKSKKLRDDVLKALLSNEFSEYKIHFPFIEFNSFVLNRIAHLENDPFAEFFRLFAIYILDFEYEESCFKALFESFSEFDSFYIGIGNSFECASSSLLKILKIEIEKMKSKFFNKFLNLENSTACGRLIDFLEKELKQSL